MIAHESMLIRSKLDQGFAVACINLERYSNIVYRGTTRELPFKEVDGEVVFEEMGYLSTTLKKNKALEFAYNLTELRCDGGVVYVIMDIEVGLPYIDLIGPTMTHWTGNLNEYERLFRKPKLTIIYRNSPRPYLNQKWYDSWNEEAGERQGSRDGNYIIGQMKEIEKLIREKEEEGRAYENHAHRYKGEGRVSIIFVKMNGQQDEEWEALKNTVRAECLPVYKYDALAKNVDGERNVGPTLLPDY